MAETQNNRPAPAPAAETIRLECLKLAHTHGLEAKHVLERAKEYETYVNGAAAD